MLWCNSGHGDEEAYEGGGDPHGRACPHFACGLIQHFFRALQRHRSENQSEGHVRILALHLLLRQG